VTVSVALAIAIVMLVAFCCGFAVGAGALGNFV
jgi:hypothetical protein